MFGFRPSYTPASRPRPRPRFGFCPWAKSFESGSLGLTTGSPLGPPEPLRFQAQDVREALGPNPKIEGEQAGGSTRRSAAEPGPNSQSVRRSGGGLQGDSVAEGFELA